MANPNLHFASLSTTAKSTLKQLKLSEAATFLRGSSLSKDDVREVADDSNGAPCVLYGHLYTTYGEITYSSKYETDAEIDEKVISKAGDVLMPTSDVTPRGLATATCVMFDNAIVGGDINILRPQPGIDGRYLSLAINSQKQKLYPLIVGSTIRHLHASDLKGLSYFFPSIEEQQKIAEFFTALDEKIHSIENKLSLLDRTKKYFVNALLQKKLRFVKDNGSAYTDWVSCTIESIASKIHGGGTPSKVKNDYWKGSLPWISSSDIKVNDIHNVKITRFITSEAVNNSSTKLVPKNSILIVSRVGVGKVAIAPKDLYTSQDFTNILDPKCNPTFLAYALLNTMSRKVNSTQGSAIKGITSDEIKGYNILLPDVKEQQKIAEFLSALDEKIRIHEQKIETLKQLKKAFMQRMFV